VITVFPKEDFLLAGYITACWTGARFFPYFHNTYLENRRGLALAFARWLQRRVFERAERVLVISGGMLDLYRARYPGTKFSLLPHSFSEKVPAFVPPPSPRSNLNLILMGNINESCRDAAVRISSAVARLPDTKLLLLSGTPRPILGRLGMLHDRVRFATVSRDALLEELKRGDVVVLPHGFDGGLARDEYQTIFPTRTIEYLICGRPILAHAPPNCYLSRFLKRENCALLVDVPDVRAVMEGIERLRADADLRSRLVRNALRTAHMFQASHVADTLRGYLDVPNPAVGTIHMVTPAR
jgi:glycosyltransferase involved in cell wall biosynthesis